MLARSKNCPPFPEWTKGQCMFVITRLVVWLESASVQPNVGCLFLPWSVPVIRQLNSSIAISSLTSGQCRLAPLIQVIQDSSHLYHFTVKLLFKLHACKIYHILKRSKVIFIYGGHYLLLWAFQVFLLTLYKDTVNVSMTSSVGWSSSLTLSKGMLLLCCIKEQRGFDWTVLHNSSFKQCTPFLPISCIHSFTNYSFYFFYNSR